MKNVSILCFRFENQQTGKVHSLEVSAYLDCVVTTTDAGVQTYCENRELQGTASSLEWFSGEKRFIIKFQK